MESVIIRTHKHAETSIGGNPTTGERPVGGASRDRSVNLEDVVEGYIPSREKTLIVRGGRDGCRRYFPASLDTPPGVAIAGMASLWLVDTLLKGCGRWFDDEVEIKPENMVSFSVSTKKSRRMDVCERTI